MPIAKAKAKKESCWESKTCFVLTGLFLFVAFSISFVMIFFFFVEFLLSLQQKMITSQQIFTNCLKRKDKGRIGEK